MPELSRAPAAKVRCLAPPSALDALPIPSGTLCGRIAPDELILVGEPGTAPALVAHAEERLERGHSLVVDHSDGWALFTLAGSGLEEVFARVSHVPLPDDAPDGGAFLMGKACDVAAKLFVRPGRIDLLCGSEVAHHVEERLEHAGHGLGLRHVEAGAVVPTATAGVGAGA